MSQNCTPALRITRSLLGYGVIAGPLYVAVSLAQALTREGFDLSRHAWSLLANGDLGWIQVTNLILTGLMTVAAAYGLRRALTGDRTPAAGRARTWAPLLLTGYGVSLVAAGVFRADAAQGFPAGAPESTTMSWHGGLHFLAGGIGFLCVIAACFVLGGRFVRGGRRGLAWFSWITGVAFLAAFAGIASGSHGPTVPAFIAAVLLLWTWIATICVHFYRESAGI